MENLWGYRLVSCNLHCRVALESKILVEQAVHPTEKSFRPSHRAAVHGSIVQDVSYYGVLEMKGPINLLKKVLSQCCDPQVPSGSLMYVVLSLSLKFLERLTYIQVHLRRPFV